MHLLVYDLTLGKPGCAILQAALGGDHYRLGMDFPAQSWLIYPTEHMRLYELTDREYEQAKNITRRVMQGEDILTILEDITTCMNI